MRAHLRRLALTCAVTGSLLASAQAPATKAKPGAPKKPAVEAVPPAAAKPPEAPAKPAVNTADASLLRAILAAYEPTPEEIRVLAVEDLGLLGDPRALNVLADFALDPFPGVQLAAVRAIRSFQHPRAEEILANFVRHPRPSEAVKLAALEGLAFQRTRSAQILLESIRADDRHGARIQTMARELIARAAATTPSPPPAP